MIKNIIFDLGGVLLDIDYQRTVEAFRNLGLEHPELHFTKEIQTEVFQKYEKGLISDQYFLQTLGEFMPHANLQEIEVAWCALLGDFPYDRFLLLERLRKKYRLFVLSNTNRIHQLRFEEIIENAYGWDRFESLFQYIGYSHRMHERKPDGAIFRQILEQNRISAAESFFIDDTEVHVRSARLLGIHAHHLKASENIQAVFRAW